MEAVRHRGDAGAGALAAYIAAIASRAGTMALATREGWEVASAAVESSIWLADAALIDPALAQAAEAATRDAADIYAQMLAAATGRMPSIAAAMEAVAGEERAAIDQLESHGARLRSLGGFDAARAGSLIQEAVEGPLAAALLPGGGELAERLAHRLESISPGAVHGRHGRAADPEHAIEMERRPKMDEEKVQETPQKKEYERAKVYPSDVWLTKKVFENDNGTKRTSAFVHCPKGMQVDGVDLSGYEIRTTLAEFQVDNIKSGKPVNIGFDPDRPVTAFKGFDEKFEMVDPVAFDTRDFCQALEAAVAQREAAKENYVRINIPAIDIRTFEQTSRAGKTYQKAAATLPEGTVVGGQDASGRTAFFFMSRFNAADLEAGREKIGFSVKRDDVFDLVADRDSGEPAIRATGGELAAAVREAAAMAADDRLPEGASLSDLEASTRATTEAMCQAPAEDAPVR